MEWFSKSDQEDMNDMCKAGEGSRGGKVIGHTKGGKPIYDKYDHPSHKNFTKEEHEWATDAHRTNLSVLSSAGGAGTLAQREGRRDQYDSHMKNMQQHEKTAKNINPYIKKS